MEPQLEYGCPRFSSFPTTIELYQNYQNYSISKSWGTTPDVAQNDHARPTHTATYHISRFMTSSLMRARNAAQLETEARSEIFPAAFRCSTANRQNSKRESHRATPQWHSTRKFPPRRTTPSSDVPASVQRTQSRSSENRVFDH